MGGRSMTPSLLYVLMCLGLSCSDVLSTAMLGLIYSLVILHIHGVSESCAFTTSRFHAGPGPYSPLIAYDH